MAPREAPRIARLERLRGPGWAAVPIASIVGVVFAIRYLPDSATALTFLALVTVPPLAAAALGWAMRGARGWAALGAVPLFVLAWTNGHSLGGEAAAVILSALSCVTLGVLLATVTPKSWLKAGIVLMAAADAWLVISHLLRAPNAHLLAAHPPAGLPRLQVEIFGTVSMGYGDLFVAALLGAALAAQASRQRRAAVMTLVIAALFDLLFLAVAELPATVPVALALLVEETVYRISAGRRLSMRAGAIPRQAR